MAIGFEVEKGGRFSHDGEEYSIAIADKRSGAWRGDGDFSNDFADITPIEEKVLLHYGSGLFQLLIRRHNFEVEEGVPHYDILTRNEFLLIAQEEGGKLVARRDGREVEVTLSNGKRINMNNLPAKVIKALDISIEDKNDEPEPLPEDMLQELGLEDVRDWQTWVDPVYEIALKQLWLIAEKSELEVRRTGEA